MYNPVGVSVSENGDKRLFENLLDHLRNSFLFINVDTPNLPFTIFTFTKVWYTSRCVNCPSCLKFDYSIKLFQLL